MKRFAAHIIELSPNDVIYDGFIEMEDDGSVVSVRQLAEGEETANTIYIDGVIKTADGEEITAGKRMRIVAVERVEWTGRNYKVTENSTIRLL